MRLLFTLIAFLIPYIPCLAQMKVPGAHSRPFIITGIIDNMGSTKVLLTNRPKNGHSQGHKIMRYDSVTSRNGQFRFEVYPAEVQYLSIELPEIGRGWTGFIADPAESGIHIEGALPKFWNAKASGSAADSLHERYNEAYYAAVKSMNPVYDTLEKIRKQDTAAARKYSDEMVVPFNNAQLTRLLRFVADQPDNFGGLAEFYNMSEYMPLDSARKYFQLLSPRMKQHSIGRKMKYELFDYHQLVGDGIAFPAFQLPDTSGTMRSVKEFRGSYVLVDYWASWCGPCMEELPAVRKLAEKFGEKGLKIFAVSLDTQRKPWTEATRRLEIPWANVSDLKGGDSKAAVLLKVKEIPAKFLLGPDGKIVLKNATLDDIEKLLSAKLDK